MVVVMSAATTLTLAGLSVEQQKYCRNDAVNPSVSLKWHTLIPNPKHLNPNPNPNPNPLDRDIRSPGGPDVAFDVFVDGRRRVRHRGNMGGSVMWTQNVTRTLILIWTTN